MAFTQQFVITSTPPPTPTAITFSPASVTIPTTTTVGTLLATIKVTMSDGSAYKGNLSFGLPNNNGGGACALVAGTTLVAPTNATLVDSDGTWSFGPGPPQSNGYAILLNGSHANGGFSSLLLSYNGHTYAETPPPTQAWYQWSGSGWLSVAGDPRGLVSGTITLGKTLTVGTYTCTVVAN